MFDDDVARDGGIAKLSGGIGFQMQLMEDTQKYLGTDFQIESGW